MFTSPPGKCFKYSKHVRRQLAQGIEIQGAVETQTGVQNLPGARFNIPNMRADSSPRASRSEVRLKQVMFTSPPGKCFKYSKHVRRQLAQGIEIQGAVETQTGVQNLPGARFNIPNMRADSSPRASRSEVRLKQRREGDWPRRPWYVRMRRGGDWR